MVGAKTALFCFLLCLSAGIPDLPFLQLSNELRTISISSAGH